MTTEHSDPSLDPYKRGQRVKLRTMAVAAVAVTTALATAAYAAGSSDDRTDSPAARWLKRHPGGTLTGLAEITYARGEGLLPVVVTFEQQATVTQPDCPPDRLCLYAGPQYGYPRAVTEACGYVDLTRIGWARRTRSIHNNLPGGDHRAGTVEFIRSDGGVPSDATRHKVLTLNPAARTAVNTADIDYLYRFC